MTASPYFPSKHFAMTKCKDKPSQTAPYRTMPSKRCLNHLVVSSRLMRWLAPILLFMRLRRVTRSPGRVMQQ